MIKVKPIRLRDVHEAIVLIIACKDLVKEGFQGILLHVFVVIDNSIRIIIRVETSLNLVSSCKQADLFFSKPTVAWRRRSDLNVIFRVFSIPKGILS